MVHHVPTSGSTPSAKSDGLCKSEWQPIETAPIGRKALVWFSGVGEIVAYRDAANPDVWIRYLGFGKSYLWPAIHGGYATHWMPLPGDPIPALAQSERKL